MSDERFKQMYHEYKRKYLELKKSVQHGGNCVKQEGRCSFRGIHCLHKHFYDSVRNIQLWWCSACGEVYPRERL